MTEELKQKAEKWVQENACDWCINADECEQGCIDCHGISGYIAGATEVTKELQEEITQLKVRVCNSEAGCNGLNLRVARLQEQIEKMKEQTVSCCEGCERLPKLWEVTFGVSN